MTQKKIIAIVLLCALTAACSKDETGDSDSNSSATAAHKYTYGYFHPEKKVKKIIESYNSEWNNDSIVYEFTWSGNNLQTIKETEYSEYSGTSITTYTYHYGMDGYIDQIIEKEQDRIHGDTFYFVYRNNDIAYYTTEMRQYLGNDYIEIMKPTFDANGNLTAYNDYPVTYGTNNDGDSTVTFRKSGSFVEWLYMNDTNIHFPLLGFIDKGINFSGYLDVGALYALKYFAAPYDTDFWLNLDFDADGYITKVVYNSHTHRFIY